MSLLPEDSASQVGDVQERDRRLLQDTENDVHESERDITLRIRDNVTKYMGVNEKLKKLNTAVREFRKERASLEHNLIVDMQKLEVENLQLKRGHLATKRSMPKVSLTKTNILSMLSRNIDDQELVTQIVNILYDKRDRYEKIELAHYSKKQE
jgi:hypothetical protein